MGNLPQAYELFTRVYWEASAADQTLEHAWRRDLMLNGNRWLPRGCSYNSKEQVDEDVEGDSAAGLPIRQENETNLSILLKLSFILEPNAFYCIITQNNTKQLSIVCVVVQFILQCPKLKPISHTFALDDIFLHNKEHGHWRLFGFIIFLVITANIVLHLCIDLTETIPQ